MGTAHTTTKEMEIQMVTANRAQRRRATSKKRGGTQTHHTTIRQKLKAESDERVHNSRLFKQADE